MVEIELKFRVDDHAPIAERLVALGAIFQETSLESDHYFNSGFRDFQLTDEVFRLRTTGTKSVMTYKGPKQTGIAKTREEIEVPLQLGFEDQFERMIQALGFRKSAQFAKKRTTYELNRGGFTVHVCLDTLTKIGQFVELEIVAEKNDLVPAESVLSQTAKELNLTQPEYRAYLRMVLEAQNVTS